MSAPQTNTTLASIGVLISASLWGIYWIPLRHLNAQSVSISAIILLINLPAALILLGWIIRKEPKGTRLGPVLIGCLAGLAITLYGYSITYTSVVRAAMLFYLMPVWATLIGVFWLAERITWRRWAAACLGMSGFVLLVTLDEDRGFGVGDYVALTSGAVWAISGALIKRGGEVPLSPLVFGQFASSALLAIFIGLMIGQPVLLEIRTLDFPSFALGISISVVVMLPAVVMLFSASQLLFPGRVGLLLMAEVVVALISATLLLPEETLVGVEWLAVALIVSASVVELIPQRKAI